MERKGKILSISEINGLTPEQFGCLFGNVVEECPEAAREVASHKPFSSVAHLKKEFNDYLEGISVEEKVNVLLKHPDITAILKDKDEIIISSDSHNEQKSAGIDNISSDVRYKLEFVINSYKDKYQFPFVICVRENKIPDIISIATERLKNTRKEEIDCSIQEVKKICYLRIDNLVWPDVLFNE